MAAVIPTTFGCCQLIVELGDGQPNIAIDRYVIDFTMKIQLISPSLATLVTIFMQSLPRKIFSSRNYF